MTDNSLPSELRVIIHYSPTVKAEHFKFTEFDNGKLVIKESVLPNEVTCPRCLDWMDRRNISRETSSHA